jgi:diguanylate cyclase (GGDEF)-like protein
MVGTGAVGLALLSAAPWLGWWTFILLALSVLNFVNVERRIGTSARPERVSACAIVITMLLIATGVVLSGGPRSAALPWLVLPAAMAAARFRAQVVIATLALTIVVILGSTLGIDTGATLADPVPVIAALALLAGVVSIVLALQAAELHHRDEAILDPLTGLLNRHALAPRFAELSVQARVNNQPVCLMLCDVDSFKTVNDEHGHDRGDAALRDVAYTMRTQLRSFELMYRLGGEEFLVVLAGAELADAVDMAERLRAAVEQARPAATVSRRHRGRLTQPQPPTRSPRRQRASRRRRAPRRPDRPDLPPRSAPRSTRSEGLGRRKRGRIAVSRGLAPRGCSICDQEGAERCLQRPPQHRRRSPAPLPRHTT